MNSILTSRTPVLATDVPLLARLIINRVCAGFPSPAEDLGAQRVGLAFELDAASSLVQALHSEIAIDDSHDGAAPQLHRLVGGVN